MPSECRGMDDPNFIRAFASIQKSFYMCRYNLQPLFLLGNRLQLQKPTIANKNGRPSSFPGTISSISKKTNLFSAVLSPKCVHLNQK